MDSARIVLNTFLPIGLIFFNTQKNGLRSIATCRHMRIITNYIYYVYLYLLYLFIFIIFILTWSRKPSRPVRGMFFFLLSAECFWSLNVLTKRHSVRWTNNNFKKILSQFFFLSALPICVLATNSVVSVTSFVLVLIQQIGKSWQNIQKWPFYLPIVFISICFLRLGQIYFVGV